MLLTTVVLAFSARDTGAQILVDFETSKVQYFVGEPTLFRTTVSNGTEPVHLSGFFELSHGGFEIVLKDESGKRPEDFLIVEHPLQGESDMTPDLQRFPSSYQPLESFQRTDVRLLQPGRYRAKAVSRPATGYL